ncbi:hypothetical protein POX_h09579 [Penicillium oxalicum]|uniref:hypothetical protein n=1 Tax=Penicillium oxalicum TaxID=69781 RepID=UPI0020B85FC0|nr:hypothetical protein POX_h09579 [Penicillium oxalicum]KAI2785819.1 hypothetical protein POX_h09579 [Penicillium oxalicum]
MRPNNLLDVDTLSPSSWEESVGRTAVVLDFNLGPPYPASIPVHAIQPLPILAAPVLYAASIYVVLGHLVTHLHAEQMSLICVRWMTKIIVAGDVLSILTQSAGGDIMAGLLIQLISFEFFVVISAIFHFRIGRQPTPWAQKDRVLSMRRTWRERNWGSLLLTLYMTSGLILIRSIFRVIEYQGGPDGYFITLEAYSFIFVTHI